VSKLSVMTSPVRVIYSHRTVKMSDISMNTDSCVNTNTSMRNKEYLTYDDETFPTYRSLILSVSLSVCPSVLLSACIGVAYNGRGYVKFGIGD
jgi:hypothetical protein